MRRRALLAAIGSSFVAGCTRFTRSSDPTTGEVDPSSVTPSPDSTVTGASQNGATATGATPTGTTTDGTTPRSTWAPTRSVAVESTATVAANVPVSLDAAVRRRTSNPFRPPTVRVTATNEGDREWSLYCGPRPIFATQRSEERDPGLALVASGEPVDTPLHGCWRLTDGLGYPAANPTVASLEPGESASVDLGVYGGPENGSGACLPPGTYTFVESYNAWRPGQEPELDLESSDFEWRFEVRV